MDTEAFVSWALDPARSLEERYTTERLVEEAVQQWYYKRQIYERFSIDKAMEVQRQRALNPAYEPRYSEESVRRAAEVLPEKKHWSAPFAYRDRPIRDLAVLRLLPQLEEVECGNSEVVDVSPLADLPRLRSLKFGSSKCEDFRPLARCAGLRELALGFEVPWPEVAGLERLAELESLNLSGNLLAFAPGVSWPKVRRAMVKCSPLAARSMRELPQLPACAFLTIDGVDRLEGIEAFPEIRNLTLGNRVRDFAPLVALRELTCFSCQAHEPLDVSPLARLPKLLYASFNTQFKMLRTGVPPRDFSVLTDAPELRELHVEGCDPVKTEVAAVNAALPSWNDLFLRAEARPLGPLRLICAPQQRHRARPDWPRLPEEPELIDEGVRRCEGLWAGRQMTRAISRKLGAEDWGHAEGNGHGRVVSVTIQAFAVVEKLPLIVEAVRECLARFRPEYHAQVMIALTAPPPPPTPAQIELEKKFQKEQDEAEFEIRMREEAEYLERLHRYQLKKEEGGKVDPAEFAPGEQEPLPPPPWERDEDEDEEEDEDSSSDVVVKKKKPEPPPNPWDDEHPLADQYRLLSWVWLSEMWFYNRDRSLAEYLMGRAMDEVIPEPPDSSAT